MNCPRCQRGNPPGGAFCMFCGAPLSGEAPAAGEEMREMRRMLRMLLALTDRVIALEHHVGLGARPSAEPPPARVATPLPAAPAMEPAALVRGVPAVEPGVPARVPEREAALPSLPTRPSWAAAPSEVSPQPPPPPPAGPLLPAIDWEKVLGRNWFAIIGALALAIGAGFFLKLAFENNWIGVTGRVILGMSTGLALLGAGEYTQRRYPIWAQAVTGGGIGILYLSTYAAFGLYHLIDPLPAFIFLGLVAALGGGLALRYESLVIALLSIIGAFLAPVLLGRALDPELRFLVIVYLLVVDAGILGVSTFRNWRWLTLVGLVASYGIYWGFLGEIPAGEKLAAQLGLTGIFLIFVGATTLFHLLWRRAAQESDMALMTLNALAYYGLTYGLLWSQYKEWFGLITLGVSLFYGLIGYGALRRPGAPPQVALFSVATALVFLTVAVPLQLRGSWIGMAWAAEGAVLVWVGFLLGSWRARAFGLGVLAVAAFRLLIFDTPVKLEGFMPVLNERFPSFSVAILAFYAAAYFYGKEKRLEDWERSISLALAGAAHFLSLWLLSAEVIAYFDSREIALRTGQESYKQLSLTALWAVYALGLLAVALGKRSAPLRWAGLAVLSIPVAKYVLLDTFIARLDPRTFRLAVNFHFLTFLVVLGVVAFAAYLWRRQGAELAQRERNIFLVLVVVANFLALWGLSAETVRFFDSQDVVRRTNLDSYKHLSLTILWAVYALGLLAVALRKHSPPLRWAGLALLSIVVAKFVLLDTFIARLDPRTYQLVLNFHFLAFLVVLEVMVFATYLYRRQRAELTEGERNVFPILVVAANLVALWGLSAEALRFFQSQEVVLATRLTSAKHLTLTVLWAAYAVGLMAVGIVKQSSTVRLAGIALLGIPVVKLFVLDVFLLERGFRVAAFVTLGVLLLAMGFVYQRYSEAIRGFLFGKSSRA